MNKFATRLIVGIIRRPATTTRAFATSSSSTATLTPTHYLGIALIGGGVIGATFREQQTAKKLTLKRSPTEMFDMTRRPTGSLDKNDYLRRRPTEKPK